ncbi:3TM-type holin [Salinicola lusitanus]|uniref:3TM-type holin n=1 Tax=Salinicola lusitanus TaxID=1949085 RepID=UPI000DA1F4FD|nr:3TM-type holin [Salinicola lusitanus]
MNWEAIGNAVAGAAPTLGSMLAGKGGEIAGKFVAAALGVSSTPEAVNQALQSDPESLAKVRAAELSLEQARVEAETRRQETVNETMRDELQADGWFKSGWRPAVGWVMALSFGGLAFSLCAAILRDPSQLPSLMDAVITLVVAMGTVVGVNINARSNDKHVAITGQRKTSLMREIVTKANP